jgi:hypothetical protein
MIRTETICIHGPDLSNTIHPGRCAARPRKPAGFLLPPPCRHAARQQAGRSKADGQPERGCRAPLATGGLIPEKRLCFSGCQRLPKKPLFAMIASYCSELLERKWRIIKPFIHKTFIGVLNQN